MSTDKDWKSQRLFKSSGKLIHNSLFNATLYIENIFPNIYGYDVDDDLVYLISQPPWEDGLFTSRALEKIDVLDLQAQLDKYGIRISQVNVLSALKLVAKKTPYKPERTRAQRVADKMARQPPGWFEIIKNETFNSTYAFPDELLEKLIVDKDARTFQARCKVTRILSKLGFKATVERFRSNSTWLVIRRWKRISPPTEL